MRQAAIASLAGIAVVFGVSLAVVDHLTSDDTTPRPPPAGLPIETENRAPPPPPAAAPALVPPPDAEPAPEPAATPVEVAPAVGARLAASASQVDSGGQLEALRARVSSRCGSLVLRAAEDPADPTGGLDGEAVILLDLHVTGGQARVTAAKILSQGAVRPALTACAQYALRNQVLPYRAAGGSASASLTVPVVLSMVPGSPGGRAP